LSVARVILFVIAAINPQAVPDQTELPNSNLWIFGVHHDHLYRDPNVIDAVQNLDTLYTDAVEAVHKLIVAERSLREIQKENCRSSSWNDVYRRSQNTRIRYFDGSRLRAKRETHRQYLGLDYQNAIISSMDIREFQELLADRGRDLYRDMPWRNDTRPYYVLVSELMLQQTQVDRVIPKFEAFISAFPDERSLAAASLADVLTLWSGLGYNRRAKFLHEAAKTIVHDYNGAFPDTEINLLTLSGVGKNTCGAIRAYAFNQPAIFVETNVRTVYFHHFFADGDIVDDKQIVTLLEQTIDHEHPREFYWALMDYGSWLKRSGAGRLQQSKHYKKQSALKGSVREIRGQILKYLATAGTTSHDELTKSITVDDRFDTALTGLVRDGLVVTTSNGSIHLTK